MSERTLKAPALTTENATNAQNSDLTITFSGFAYTYINATKLAGIKLPAAKVIGTDNVTQIPSCTAVTAVAQTAVTSVYVVKARFSV